MVDIKYPKRRPRGRPRQLDRTQALETAMRLFWRHGYEGVSMSDLTTAMGVTAPSLYAAFGNKERLYRAALDHYAATEVLYAAQALAEEPTAQQAIERILRQSAILFSGEAGPRGCMLTMGGLGCAPDHAAVAAQTTKRRQTASANLAARFQKAVMDGELPAGTNAEVLARFYASIIQGMAIQAYDGAGIKLLDAIAETAIRAWPKKQDA